MKKTIILLSILAVLTACTKEIKFKGDQVDPKIVLNGLIEPGNPVSVNISKSVFFLDNTGDTQAPDDLVATLYVNGNRIGEMTPHFDTIYYYDGWSVYDAVPEQIIKVYTHDYCPSVGDEVKITASANGFDDVEGTTSALPNEVAWNLDDIQITLWEESFEEYDLDTIWTISANMNLYLEITDPDPGKTDYFRIHLKSGNYSDEENLNAFYISTTYDDPVFGNTATNSDIIDMDLISRPEGVFTDVLFDGRSYKIKLPLYVYITYWDKSAIASIPVPISMEHLSREYYYYLNTSNQVDEFMQFFTEPVQTYTNVNGGFGIVGGRTVDSLQFVLPWNN